MKVPLEPMEPTLQTLSGTFARALRVAREARGLTQAELAELVGLAVEACGRLERGKVLPRADTLVRLSAALGVSTDALLGLPEGEASSSRLRAAAAEPQAEYAARPEVRRLVRRLRDASPRTIRLLAALLSSSREDARPRAGSAPSRGASATPRRPAAASRRPRE